MFFNRFSLSLSLSYSSPSFLPSFLPSFVISSPSSSSVYEVSSVFFLVCVCSILLWNYVCIWPSSSRLVSSRSLSLSNQTRVGVERADDHHHNMYFLNFGFVVVLLVGSISVIRHPSLPTKSIPTSSWRKKGRQWLRVRQRRANLPLSSVFDCYGS